ncbi:MAG: hypothetical protein WCI74_16235, partial [Actinomycetes bacterium]
PEPGETTIVRMIVKAWGKPSVKVTAPTKTAGTQAVTVVGGVKALGRASWGRWRYGVTIPIIKPKVLAASSDAGQLMVALSALGLQVESSTTYVQTSSHIIGGEICHGISPFDIGNRGDQARVAFDQKLLFGRQWPGFRHVEYLGSYAMLQACMGHSARSYLNALNGEKRAADNVPPIGSSDPAPVINTSPGSTDAVVLVSGFISQTPFTTPGKVCSAKHMSVGYTWTAMDRALTAAGFPVYSAPANLYTHKSDGTSIPNPVVPSKMLMGKCPQPQLPGSMTLDSTGDFDINSSVLAGYLNYIHKKFGITRVWLLGHSAGGLWSRGALDFASFIPDVKIQSVTTLDTPYTGSFLANAAQAIVKCERKSPTCFVLAQALKLITNYVISSVGRGAGMTELESSYVAKWNSRMAGVPGGLAFYAASAIGMNLPWLFNKISPGIGKDPYYNPNDVVVGLSSQQGDGLVASGSIAVLKCFPTIPGVHVYLPKFVAVPLAASGLLNSFPGSTTSVTGNAMTVSNVANVFRGSPPTGACPSANYQQSGEYAPGKFGPWPNRK